jgi:hypothetical protein
VLCVPHGDGGVDGVDGHHEQDPAAAVVSAGRGACTAAKCVASDDDENMRKRELPAYVDLLDGGDVSEVGEQVLGQSVNDRRECRSIARAHLERQKAGEHDAYGADNFHRALKAATQCEGGAEGGGGGGGVTV